MDENIEEEGGVGGAMNLGGSMKGTWNLLIRGNLLLRDFQRRIFNSWPLPGDRATQSSNFVAFNFSWASRLPFNRLSVIYYGRGGSC